ncbi:MAG: tRNA pseudouridine(13) synthase TruD [Steroidobacteraceae bacterium]
MSEDGRLLAWRQTALEPPCAHGGAPATGVIRTDPEDFLVEERLGFAPDGGPGHFLLLVEKRDANTLFVARSLARLAALPPAEIGFAGLKDRRAVARQWFSMPARRDRPPPTGQVGDGFRVLEVHPHSRKLRRGALAANRFRLRVRELRGDLDALRARLEMIAGAGAPNYFGPQRFGRGGANLQRVNQWIESGRLPRERAARGFLLSAARSLAFNAVLGRRVADGSWNRLLPGEIASLAGSSSVFRIAGLDAELVRRCHAGDIHPSGPLCGSGDMQPADDCASVELQVLETLAPLPERLAGVVAGERRALVLRPAALAWSAGGEELEISFELRRGAFATSLLREAVAVTMPAAETD